jgi:tetratricopeptide (TPR) repeat protein
MQRQSPQEARSYLTNLTSNTNCPLDIREQALFALGDAYFAMAATPANRTNYHDALDVFLYLTRTYTNSERSYLAYGRMGECFYAFAGIDADGGTNSAERLLSYTNAIENFNKAMESPDSTTRSSAEVHLGYAYAGMARLLTDPLQRTNVYRIAFDHYLNVFDGSNQTDEQSPDMFSVKEAGMQAAALAEELGETSQSILLYQRIIKTLPSLKPTLEKKIANLQKQAGASSQKEMDKTVSPTGEHH